MSAAAVPVLTPEQLEALPPRERKAYLQAAAQLEALHKQNPLAFWEPYESPRRPGWSPQERYLASHAGIKAFFGGNGTGKTDIGTVDDLIQLCDRDVLPPHLRRFKRWEPPFYLRVVAPKEKVIESVILEKLRKYVPRDQLKGGSFDRAFSKQMMRLNFKNGSWVLFNTSDQDRDAHAGVELHRVRFDEEPEWEIYLENVNRLRAFTPSQLCFTMTPSLKGSIGWTYDEVWERRDDPDVFCVAASMLDNPHINAEKAMERLKNASQAERAAMIDGKFVAMLGRVLHSFDPEHHVVDPPTREHVQMLDVYVGIDPGVARGGVVWAGFDRDNVMLVFDELYPESQTIPQIAQQIAERNAFWGIRRPLYVIDPSARNRTLTSAESVEGEFQRAGIYTVHGQNERDAGIFQLRARCEASSLLVARNCGQWLREADRWVLVDDEVSREQAPKGKGSSGNRTAGPDHLMDPTRYVAMERVWYRRPDGFSAQHWHPGMDTAPPASWVLQGAAQPDFGPLGSCS